MRIVFNFFQVLLYTNEIIKLSTVWGRRTLDEYLR